MSICVCDSCEAFIDSDFEPECFVEDKILCELCRESNDCCSNEDRSINGGCKNCGDPSY